MVATRFCRRPLLSLQMEINLHLSKNLQVYRRSVQSWTRIPGINRHRQLIRRSFTRRLVPTTTTVIPVQDGHPNLVPSTPFLLITTAGGPAIATVKMEPIQVTVATTTTTPRHSVQTIQVCSPTPWRMLTLTLLHPPTNIIITPTTVTLILME